MGYTFKESCLMWRGLQDDGDGVKLISQKISYAWYFQSWTTQLSRYGMNYSKSLISLSAVGPVKDSCSLHQDFYKLSQSRRKCSRPWLSQTNIYKTPSTLCSPFPGFNQVSAVSTRWTLWHFESSAFHNLLRSTPAVVMDQKTISMQQKSELYRQQRFKVSFSTLHMITTSCSTWGNNLLTA